MSDEEEECGAIINCVNDESLLPVELGYVEEVYDSGETDSHHKLRLHSALFPSKVGGKPAWLGLDPLPTIAQLLCEECGEPMALLVQVYAPDSLVEHAFHRTIYVFLCRKPQCCHDNSVANFKVLRSCLARENKFYSNEPVNAEEVEDPESLPQPTATLCHVCGCTAKSKCAKCLHTWYCGQAHQVVDWKYGNHKKICANVKEHGTKALENDGPNPFVFTEFELVTEREMLTEEDVQEEKDEATRLQDYAKYVGKISKQPVVQCDLEDEDIPTEDPYFKRFRRIVDDNPEQVLRYQRGGTPLWVAPDDFNVPNCPLCHSKRTFEFQIMPHLLTDLELDSLEKSIDWATVVVFTCSQSCVTEIEGQYVQETCVIQNFYQ